MKKISIESIYEWYSLGGLCQSPKGEKGAFLKWRAIRKENGYKASAWIVQNGKVRQVTEEICTGFLLWQDERRILISTESKQAGKNLFQWVDTETGVLKEAFFLDSIEGIWLLKGLLGENCYGILRNVSPEKEDPECQVIDEIPYADNDRGFIGKKFRQLCLFFPEKGTMIPITPAGFDVSKCEASVNGQELLYAGRKKDGAGYPYEGLFCYELCSGKTICMVEEGRYRIDRMGFLEDSYVAAVSDQKRYGMDENPILWEIKKDGEKRRLPYWDGTVTGSSVNSDVRYGIGKTFQAEDERVYFVTTLRDRGCLCMGDRQQMTPLCDSEVSFDFISVRKGCILAIGTEGTGLQEIYEGKMGENGDVIFEKQTFFSAAVLSSYWVSIPKSLDFQDKAGNKIQGWILLPENYDPLKKYPAVLEIHGGPKTVYGPGFHHEMQLLASSGYIVLFCNPVGSDGRGDEFADIRGQYGKQDYEQLMEFVNYSLKEYPSIDPLRLGISGGSYGGFMVNWIIGHTGRFSAAISQRSMANMVTIKTLTDIGHYSVADHQGADIHCNAQRLWEQSPIRYAYRATTPTLFLHSTEDYRCTYVEGLQMFAELKTAGTETKLCLFKNENHDLSRKGRPNSRIRRLKEIIDWLDSHLKEERIQ